MLAVLGAMGVLLAGIALPMMFDDAEDDEAPEDETALSPEDAGGNLLDELDDPDDPGSALDPVSDPSGPGADAIATEGTATGGDALPGTSDGGTDGLSGPQGGPGDETLEGGSGPDLLDGGGGDDMLEGAGAGDTLFGGAGADGLEGGEGDDRLDGGAEGDTLKGGAGDDLLDGGTGDDLLVDGDGIDTLLGGDGDDVIHGTATGDGPDGRDHIHGGAGDDTIDAGRMDFVEGGDGADLFRLAAGIGVGEQAEFADFDPEEDRLVVLWDDTGGGPPPELTFGRIEDGEDMAQVLLDGVVVAHVAGASGLGPEDIALVGLSTL
jgi:Ca2+-binding RTX toxin-like protein